MHATRSTASTLAFALIATAAATGTGCASNGYPGLAAPDEDRSYASLRVRNDNWQDVRIYLVRESGAAPQRLGSVPSLSTGIIRLPSTSGQFVQFLLRPLGTRASYVTQPIYLERGRVIQLNVANALTQSSLIAR